MKLNVTHVRLDHLVYTGHVCRCMRPQDKLSIYSLLLCCSLKHELNIARETQASRSLKALRLTICQYERSLHHVIIVPNLKNRHEAWKLCNQHLPWRLTHTAQFLHSNTQKTWNAQSPMIWKHCTNKWSYYDTEAKQVSHPKKTGACSQTTRLRVASNIPATMPASCAWRHKATNFLSYLKFRSRRALRDLSDQKCHGSGSRLEPRSAHRTAAGLPSRMARQAQQYQWKFSPAFQRTSNLRLSRASFLAW